MQLTKLNIAVRNWYGYVWVKLCFLLLKFFQI